MIYILPIGPFLALAREVDMLYLESCWDNPEEVFDALVWLYFATHVLGVDPVEHLVRYLDERHPFILDKLFSIDATIIDHIVDVFLLFKPRLDVAFGFLKQALSGTTFDVTPLLSENKVLVRCNLPIQ